MNLQNTNNQRFINILTRRVNEKSHRSECYKHFEPNGALKLRTNEPIGSKCL